MGEHGSNIIDIWTSESEQEDLGEGVEDDSSVLDSSSDPPAGQGIPSEGPVGGYTGIAVPQPSGPIPSAFHTPDSVSNTHNVGTFATAGLRTTSELAALVLMCSAHPTTWQPGCTVCDVMLVHAPVYDPKLAVTDRLLGCITKPPTHAVELGFVGLEVARHVCHQQRPIEAKEASHLMATSLKLPAPQELELNSNLRSEAFFQDYEKQRAFQYQFEYKCKLLGLLKGIRTSLTPLFTLTDKLQSFKAKLKLFCGELGITLAELDRDAGLQKGIGPDPHPIMLAPIVAGPDVSVPLINPADHLGGFGLTEEQLFQVREKVNQIHQANCGVVDAALGRLWDMFLHVYNLSADLTFATSEHLAVFFKLSGFHDHALRSLVRQKMLTIFKPKVRQAVMRDASQSKVGLSGGDQVVSDRITESRRKDGIIRSAVLTPASSKSKSKSRKKSKSKTGAKGASSKDGEAGKAGAAKK